MLAQLDCEMHGYPLMQRVAELSDGSVKMGPGTIYGTLKRLCEDGMIEETTDRVERAAGERRRYYQMTVGGREVALSELARLQALVHRIAFHLPGAPA
jgi:DNA-binding PadR family transcriptional regulator